MNAEVEKPGVGWWERVRERRRDRRQLRAWRRGRRKGSIDPTTSLRGVDAATGGPPSDGAAHGATGVSGP